MRGVIIKRTRGGWLVFQPYRTVLITYRTIVLAPATLALCCATILEARSQAPWLPMACGCLAVYLGFLSIRRMRWWFRRHGPSGGPSLGSDRWNGWDGPDGSAGRPVRPVGPTTRTGADEKSRPDSD